MDIDSWNLIVILFCIVMSAYFSATETAFSTANKVRLKSMDDKGNKRASEVLVMLDNYDNMISSILIGNNIVNILLASLATLIFVNIFGEDKGTSISTTITTIAVLIFGEISPKCIAKEHPEKFAMFSAPILRALIVVLTPFNFVFKQWTKILSTVFKSNESQCITEEELITFVEETMNDGTIDEQESDMIKSIIELSDLVAMDVLTPRVDVTSVDIKLSIEEIENIFLDTGYSRLPIYKDNIDNILGTIYQKDFFSQVKKNDCSIESIIKPAKFITGNKNIKKLLRELQSDRSHIAIVIDEYGSMTGIVTMEDILEEIVGDIWDEEDEVVRDITAVNENDYIALGSASINILRELIDLPDDLAVTTVNGWVIEKLTAIPKVGDKFIYEEYEFEVITVSGKRTGKLSIKKIIN